MFYTTLLTFTQNIKRIRRGSVVLLKIIKMDELIKKSDLFLKKKAEGKMLRPILQLFPLPYSWFFPFKATNGSKFSYFSN